MFLPSESNDNTCPLDGLCSPFCTTTGINFGFQSPGGSGLWSLGGEGIVPYFVTRYLWGWVQTLHESCLRPGGKRILTVRHVPPPQPHPSHLQFFTLGSDSHIHYGSTSGHRKPSTPLPHSSPPPKSPCQSLGNPFPHSQAGNVT